MILHPQAKINLGLLIKGRLPNGYHILETLYFPLIGPDFPQDTLKVELNADEPFRFNVLEWKEILPPEENLVWKAWTLLKKAVPGLPGFSIELSKGLPSGAGIGGGSSDAASALLAMNELAGAPLSLFELAHLGAELGADVPFFVFNRPMIGTGIGTDLEAFDIEIPFRIELHFSGIHSSTPLAYKKLNLDQCNPHRSLKEILAKPISSWREFLVNDLEVPVFGMHPELNEIKNDFYKRGAVYAAMSGSGSAIYGLFNI